jgi:hypothetical protein
MFCKNCLYALRGLPAGPCPECATPFDPSQPATYSQTPRRLVPALIHLEVAAFAVAGAFPILVHALFVLARLTLGHWPHRLGMNDPKSMPIVKWFHLPVALTIPLSFVGAALLVLVLLAAGVKGRWIACLRILTFLGFAAAAWYIAIIDPAQAVKWFMD